MSRSVDQIALPAESLKVVGAVWQRWEIIQFLGGAWRM
jgi:hypothetical protein